MAAQWSHWLGHLTENIWKQILDIYSPMALANGRSRFSPSA